MTLTLDWLRDQFPDLTDLNPLGQGGQKLVFSARHASEGDVVLKLILRADQPEMVEREILAVNQVQSPRVPRISETGHITTPLGPVVWLREQRISGQTVRDRVRASILPNRELFRLGLHVLEALAKAEEAKIVHRDVKPDNLMVDSHGDFWLLDFGLARHLQLDSLTASNLPFGKVTWGYSPPEQCRNLKATIDARADLFALGVTLHECATGTNPFRQGAANQLEVLRRVERDPLPALNLPGPKAAAFRDLVSAMTQKRRDHRPATVQEALVWMREICEGQL